MLEHVAVALADPNGERRNQVAALLGKCHCRVEAHDRVESLRLYWPGEGVILLHDDAEAVEQVFRLAIEMSSWVPIVLYADEPHPVRVVDAVRLGAADYLPWPVSAGVVADRIAQLPKPMTAAAQFGTIAFRCWRLVNKLTPREHAVLFSLPNGASNKSIARELNISPRTIEIHRANMMSKLGASGVGQAISIALYSQLASKNGIAPDPLVS